jgi:hypothetical protein
MLKLTSESKHLLKVLESSSGSGVVPLNPLETELNECVVELGNLLPELAALLQEYAIEHLQAVRDYRRRHPCVETGDSELRQRARKILEKLP